MKKKLNRRLAVLVAGVMAVSIGLNLLAYRHAYAMMHFGTGTARTNPPENLAFLEKLRVLFCGVNLPRPQTSLTPADLGPECRALTVACTNGVRLGAWYCPGTSSNSLVILFHGYASQKTALLPEARAFLEMGHSVLLVDFRGSGDSSESYTTIGFDEAEDVASVVRYAKTQLPHRKLILYGHSMGAAAILRAVHSCGVRPDAIIVEAVFDKMLNAVRHRFEAMGVPSFPSAELLVFWGGFQAGFNGFEHNPVRYAARVDCPILFLHGTADSRAHVEEARRVFAAIPALKRFKEFPGIGHEASVVRFPGAWKEAIGRFLGEAENQPVPGTGSRRSAQDAFPLRPAINH